MIHKKLGKIFGKVSEKIGINNGLDNIGRGLGSITTSLDIAKRATVLDAMKQEKALREGLRTYDPGEVISSTEALQQGLGSRKSALRSGRDASVEARAQPGLQQVAEQSGAALRGVKGEGSRQFSQRTDIAADTELANQQVQVQALGEQLQTEQGVQQLETEFTSFFNELASNRFSREISGLSEQMNEYLSEQGAQIGYDQLEAESRKATTEMYGRFISTLGQEFSRKDKKTNYDSGSVTSMPSIFN